MTMGIVSIEVLGRREVADKLHSDSIVRSRGEDLCGMSAGDGITKVIALMRDDELGAWVLGGDGIDCRDEAGVA